MSACIDYAASELQDIDPRVAVDLSPITEEIERMEWASVEEVQNSLEWNWGNSVVAFPEE